MPEILHILYTLLCDAMGEMSEGAYFMSNGGAVYGCVGEYLSFS